MGFNYRNERKKFEQQMQENERRYRDAGMTDSQIAAMREFEEELFRKERVYGLHNVLEQSAEYPGLIELEESNDSYFQSLSSNLDFVLDDIIPGAAVGLTDLDKRILVLLSMGITQEEVSKRLGITQSTVSYHLKKVKIFLPDIR